MLERLQRELTPFFRGHLPRYVRIEWSHPADVRNDAWVHLTWGVHTTTVSLDNNQHYRVDFSLPPPLQYLRYYDNPLPRYELEVDNHRFPVTLARTPDPQSLYYLQYSADSVGPVKNLLIALGQITATGHDYLAHRYDTGVANRGPASHYVI